MNELLASKPEANTWTCEHGVTYCGSDVMISGARLAHGELSQKLADAEAGAEQNLRLARVHKGTSERLAADLERYETPQRLVPLADVMAIVEKHHALNGSPAAGAALVVLSNELERS